MTNKNTIPVRATKEAMADHGTGGPVTHWRLRDGSTILISEMTDVHLIKVINLLKRNHEKLERVRPFVEMANKINLMLSGENTFLGWSNLKEDPTYQAVTKEARSRGLSFEETLH